MWHLDVDSSPSDLGQQAKQAEWHEQWRLFRDDELFLFQEWIAPATLDDFRGKSVLECGCGGGQHTAFIAPVAANVTVVDLKTVDIARKRGSLHCRSVMSGSMRVNSNRTQSLSANTPGSVTPCAE